MLLPKAPPGGDAKRLAFIRTLNCVICNAPPPSEAAHIRMGLAGGMGMKGPDKWTVPLCHRCHSKQHNEKIKDGAGEVAFWRDEISVNKPLLVSILRGYAESLSTKET